VKNSRLEDEKSLATILKYRWEFTEKKLTKVIHETNSKGNSLFTGSGASGTSASGSVRLQALVGNSPL